MVSISEGWRRRWGSGRGSSGRGRGRLPSGWGVRGEGGATVSSVRWRGRGLPSGSAPGRLDGRSGWSWGGQEGGVS